MIKTIHSNIVNDLRGSFRRWRHSKLQFVVIAVSISLITALTTTLLHLGFLVSSDRPAFVKTDKALVTLIRTTMNNTEKPVKGYQVDKLGKLDAVLEVGKLGIERSRVRTPNKLTDEVNIGFLDSSLVELLELPAMLNSLESNTHTVFVTPEFWRKYLSNFNLNQKPQIKFYDTKKTYVVAGLVPEAMSKWRSLEVGIYAHFEELQHFAPFRLTEREKSDPQKLQQNIVYTRNYLSGAPQYFGFAQVKPNVNIDDLKRSYEEMDSNVGDAVVFIEEYHKTIIAKGVELNPITQQKVLGQWRALLFLSVVLLITIISSLIYSQIGQLLHRKKELTIKRAIGATKTDLIKECSLELLPNLIISQMVSFGVYVFFFKLMASSKTLTQYFNQEALQANLTLFTSVSLVICFFLCMVFSLPFVSAFKRMKLSASKSDSLTSSETRILKTNEFLQKVMLLASMFLMILTLYELKKISEADTFELDLVEFRVVSKDFLALSESFKEGQFDSLFANRTTIMFDSFINPIGLKEDVSVDNDAESFVSVSTLHVAGNLFPLANVKLLAGTSDMKRGETVINAYLAERLTQQLKMNDVSDLLGRNLMARGFMNTKTLKIVGVADNLPHYGFSNRERPILYKPYTDLPKLYERGFYALVEQSYAQDFEDFLVEWADENAGTYSMERKNAVRKQLFDLEFQQNMTRRTSLVVSVLIATLLLFNIFHISQTNLKLEKRRLGVLLAIGESKNSLALENGTKQIAPLFIALPVVLASAVFGQGFIEKNLQVDIVNINNFILATLFTLVSLTVINVLCAKHFLAKPISRLL